MSLSLIALLLALLGVPGHFDTGGFLPATVSASHRAPASVRTEPTDTGGTIPA